MRSNVNYRNGYRRLPIKIPETIPEIVSGHLFESDFRLCFKMFLDVPLGYTLSERRFHFVVCSCNNHYDSENNKYDYNEIVDYNNKVVISPSISSLLKIRQAF